MLAISTPPGRYLHFVGIQKRYRIPSNLKNSEKKPQPYKFSNEPCDNTNISTIQIIQRKPFPVIHSSKTLLAANKV